MKAFCSAVVAMVVIAIVAAVVLDQFSMSAETMNSTGNVRLQ